MAHFFDEYPDVVRQEVESLKALRIGFVLAASILMSVFFLSSQHVRATGSVNVSVTLYFPGSGTIASVQQPGINCPPTCSYPFPNDPTTLTLTFTPNTGFVGGGWSGSPGCNGGPANGGGSAACTFTATNYPPARSAMAYAAYSTYHITATPTGTGSGTVSGLGSHAGYSTVNLTAQAAAGSVFSGWQTNGDACSLGGGKGGASSVNPSPTCSLQACCYTQTINVVPEFTKSSAAPASTQAPSAPQPSSQSSPTPTPAAGLALGASSGAIKLIDVVVDGKTINMPANQAITVTGNQPLVLSGTTTPNASVMLTIHSTPRTATVVADAKGNWRYTVSGLEAGSHYVEAAVTDPVSHQTSAETKLLSFTVTSAKTAPPAAASQGNALVIAVAVVLVVAVTIAGVLVWRRKQAHQPAN